VLQAWRTAAQQRLRASLSVNAAALVRYLFGLPFALVLLALFAAIFDPGMVPPLGPMFWLWCLAGGLAQIIATNLLIMAFGYRNFVVGTAYSKTEALQTAIFAWALLGEQLHWLAWAGIMLGLVGILILSFRGSGAGAGAMLRDLGSPVARAGIASGFFFGITAVLIKMATQEVDHADGSWRALIVLVVVLAMQSAMQGGYIMLREREQFAAMARQWRQCTATGFLAATGSACWFVAFVFAPVAMVRIVGQVETIFTLVFGHFYLREPIARHEVAGLLCIAAAIMLALAGTL